MGTWVAIAAREIFSPGIGVSLLPRFVPTALDGIAIGTMLSGACLLLIIAPRHTLRRSRRRLGMFTVPDRAFLTRRGDGRLARPGSDQLGDEATEVIAPPGVRPQGAPDSDEAHPDGRKTGYRSRHRRDEQESGQWRPESRQRTPRHAAPSAGFSSRIASRLPARTLAGASRD